MPTHAQTPQPPRPPATPPATAYSPATHRRQRTFSSSSSSSSSSASTSSSLSTASSAACSPSPSPRGRGSSSTATKAGRSSASTTTTTTTSVPFSWEHHPGIPKTRLPHADAASSVPAPLPPPPPLRAPPSSAAYRGHHHRRRAAPPCAATADPFAAALAECTRERSSDAGLMDSLFPASPAPPVRHRWSIAAKDGSGAGGFLDLYGCKNAMAVAEGAFIVRRPVAVARPGHGRVGRAGRR